MTTIWIAVLLGLLIGVFLLMLSFGFSPISSLLITLAVLLIAIAVARSK